MPKRKQIRRHAILPLEPHVQAALKRLRGTFSALNQVPLIDTLPEVKMSMFLSISRELASDVINFVNALHCSVDDPTQPSTLTIKE